MSNREASYSSDRYADVNAQLMKKNHFFVLYLPLFLAFIIGKLVEPYQLHGFVYSPE
ncbi:hypothetical protein [Pedobacter sp. HMWF019]|uniref:hypothetical protein n=1 Tax=Pedobacter sp. HMWF019 TaxID=2056856 RepID=UPI00130487A1|nr:hypothetical protein [Pedobacter sp. HMWF019]